MSSGDEGGVDRKEVGMREAVRDWQGRGRWKQPDEGASGRLAGMREVAAEAAGTKEVGIGKERGQGKQQETGKTREAAAGARKAVGMREAAGDQRGQGKRQG